jgi:hypothetical protein
MANLNAWFARYPNTFEIVINISKSDAMKQTLTKFLRRAASV